MPALNRYAGDAQTTKRCNMAPIQRIERPDAGERMRVVTRRSMKITMLRDNARRDVAVMTVCSIVVMRRDTSAR